MEYRYLVIPNHFSQPIIKHDTDHYTADKGVDKAVFIILSLLTDKQAYFPETLKPSPQDSAPPAKCFCNHDKTAEAATYFFGWLCFLTAVFLQLCFVLLIVYVSCNERRAREPKSFCHLEQNLKINRINNVHDYMKAAMEDFLSVNDNGVVF